MAVSTRILRFLAVAVSLFLAGHPPLLIRAENHVHDLPPSYDIGRSTVSVSVDALETSAGETNPEDVFSVEKEKHEEDDAVDFREQRQTPDRKHRYARRGVSNEIVREHRTSLTKASAVALLATTALVAWLIVMRLNFGRREPFADSAEPTELAEVQPPVAESIPEPEKEIEEAKKLEEKLEEPQEKIPQEKILKKGKILTIALQAFALFLFLVPWVMGPEASTQAAKRIMEMVVSHPLQIALALVTGEVIRRKVKRTQLHHVIDWGATADLFIKHTAMKDRKNLRMRLGHALQLIAGADEQAVQGHPESLLHVHPLQLRDFRIGAYAVALWLAANARVARLASMHDKSVQAEMKRVLQMSDALRRLSMVTPVPNSKLDLNVPDYKKNWRRRLVLPRISRDDLSDLIELTARVYMKLSG